MPVEEPTRATLEKERSALEEARRKLQQSVSTQQPVEQLASVETAARSVLDALQRELAVQKGRGAPPETIAAIERQIEAQERVVRQTARARSESMGMARFTGGTEKAARALAGDLIRARWRWNNILVPEKPLPNESPEHFQNRVMVASLERKEGLGEYYVETKRRLENIMRNPNSTPREREYARKVLEYVANPESIGLTEAGIPPEAFRPAEAKLPPPPGAAVRIQATYDVPALLGGLAAVVSRQTTVVEQQREQLRNTKSQIRQRIAFDFLSAVDQKYHRNALPAGFTASQIPRNTREALTAQVKEYLTDVGGYIGKNNFTGMITGSRAVVGPTGIEIVPVNVEIGRVVAAAADDLLDRYDEMESEKRTYIRQLQDAYASAGLSEASREAIRQAALGYNFSLREPAPGAVAPGAAVPEVDRILAELNALASSASPEDRARLRSRLVELSVQSIQPGPQGEVAAEVLERFQG